MMVHYKSVRYIDGKSRWIIEDEKGVIIRDPTKEQLKLAVVDNLRRISKGRKCYICGTDDTCHWRTYVDQRGVRHKNIYVCNTCGRKFPKELSSDGDMYDSVMLEVIDKNDMLYTVEGRVCYNCGNDKTYIYKNKPVWYKYYDDDENLVKGPYLCDKCYRLFQILRPNDDDKPFEHITCNICGSNDTYIRKNGVPMWYNDIDDKGMKTGKKICVYCKQKIYRSMPYSHNNLIKLLRNWRTGNIDILSNEGKGFLTECVIVKVIGASNLNIDMNNFSWPYDLVHEKYRKINVKGRSPYYNMWIYDTYGKENCDTYFLVGFSKDRKSIESVHIVPNDEWIKDLTKITIVKDPSKISKYGQFKVDKKVYNDTYYSLMEFLKDKKRFGTEDIKRWFRLENIRYDTYLKEQLKKE